MNLANLRYFLDTTTNISWVLPWGDDDDLDDDDTFGGGGSNVILWV